MNPAALMYALQALEVIPQLISAGQNVIGLVEHTTSAMKKMVAENRDPTPGEWDDLNQKIDDLRAQLHST